MLGDVDLHYPATAAERSDWIVARRPPRNVLDPSRPYAFFMEEELSARGEIVPIATIFLTNRECPWRCAMCDLWKNTLTESLEPGMIPQQIQFALDRLPPAREIKLYNSGSFFDPRAIPSDDDAAITELIRAFDRVIVECHPTLVGERGFAFGERLDGQLEVAMGLETAHPEVLAKLNKRMTVEQFAGAAEKLHEHNIDLRVFLLVRPPFMKPEESLEWTQRSIDLAFQSEATAVSLIPTRGGNGSMEALAQLGEFAPPSLAALETSVEYGVRKGFGRVFADLWDLRRAAPRCAHCWPARIDRLQVMNLAQQVAAPIECAACGGLS